MTPKKRSIGQKKTPKKSSIGQKEPLDTPCNQPPRKKKKVSGRTPKQSTREPDGETAPSGVNTREENQLSSGHKEVLRTSETAQEDTQKEEKMILQRIPLQRKLAEITSKYGITDIHNSVELCLSMCVEERMRAIITGLIKMSKMRVDPEVPVHQKSITSDVRLQIQMINCKAKQVYEKQQAEEAIMLQKRDEANKLAKDNIQINPTVGKDDLLLKLQLLAEEARRQKHDWRISAANKAANNAVRTAIGGEDLLSRWKLMAEQAREKCQGSVSKDASQTAVSTPRGATCDNEKAKNTTSARTTPSSSRKSETESITLRRTGRRDVIAIMERDTYMSKSALLYRYYEKSADR